MSPSQLLDPPSSRLNSPESEFAAEGVERGVSDVQTIYEAFDPTRLTRDNIDWITLGWMVLMHAGCLVAPFYFTWQALGVAVVLHWLTSSIGICLCYHRYLSHRSFKLKSPAEFFVVLCGVLSGEGSPLTWTATHRLHHQRSDQYGDPHSPLDGPWWSHILWLFMRRTPAEQDLLFRRYVPELIDRPILKTFEKTYGLWLIGSGVLLYAVGGLPMLLWGLCMRLVIAYHSTWFVNSATHLWGYRNYETRDESRNLWWVALLSYGEGWHNNHHAHPHSARAGHKWWEIDMTFWSIRALEFLGLATDVDDRNPSQPQAVTSKAA